jgi:predicted permease
MGDQTGLIPSFLAAIQASLSVLLVISYGGIAAKLGLLNSTVSKSISKICVRMFLPALLLAQIGSELHAGSVNRYIVIFAWALICHFVSFLIGITAHLLLGMPDWITAAIMFNNTTSYPLLLVQSLDETGILSSLITGNETTRAAISRAKSYFLVFATVSSCLTFAVGPRLIDSEHAPEPPSDKEEESDEEEVDLEQENATSRRYSVEPCSPTDRTHLLIPGTQPRRPSSFRSSVISAKVYDRRPSFIPKKRWFNLNERSKWWLLFFSDFLNAPLLGAMLGVIIGLVPALHVAFFSPTNEGGIFSAWLTASLQNIGGLFVPLPVVVAGVSLYTSMKNVRRVSTTTNPGEARTPWLTSTFVLVIRFGIWPLVSIATIYFLAKETEWLGEDPMLWFTMMLMPTGPPAMKLITLVEVSDGDEEDEHKIAKLLTVSYYFPLPCEAVDLIVRLTFLL